jgi:large conductance mechanosensitive channel
MWKEFRDFAVKGNVLDLGVGLIMGAAFGKVVSSFVSDVLMPPLGLLIGHVDFSSVFVSLNGQHYPSITAAKVAGAPTLNVGLFINALIDFTFVAFAVFLIVRQANRFRQKPAVAAARAPEVALLEEIRDLLRSGK